MDIGQSGSRAKIGEQTISLAHSKIASEGLIQTLEKIYSELEREKFQKVYLSLTGLQGNVGDQTPFGKLTNSYFGSSEVAVMDDGIAAYAGAVGNRSGVVLTLGGGVVAISGRDNRFGHGDGKGPIFGDFGGGFWIGQTALRKAIATAEGRDTAFDLVKLLAHELKLHEALSDKTGVEASRLCINSAQSVCLGAESGNASALEILKEGAEHLAKTVNAAWKKVDPDNSTVPVIAYLGGLSKSAKYTSLISEEISRLLKYELVQPIGDHLLGAPLVAERFPEGVDPLLKWWRA